MIRNTLERAGISLKKLRRVAQERNEDRKVVRELDRPLTQIHVLGMIPNEKW